MSEAEKIAAGLTEAQRRVLNVLRHDYGWPLADVAEDAGLSVEDTRQARIGLRDLGLARISQGHDEDSNHIIGSFYYLTRPLGLEVREILTRSRPDGNQ